MIGVWIRPTAAKVQAKELQAHADRLIKALESIERNGQALAHICEASAGDVVLQPQRADEIRQALGHLPDTHQLLLRVRERAHQAVQKSQRHQRGRIGRTLA